MPVMAPPATTTGVMLSTSHVAEQEMLFQILLM